MELKELLPLICAEVGVITETVGEVGGDSWRACDYDELLELNGEKSINGISVYKGDIFILLEKEV